MFRSHNKVGETWTFKTLYWSGSTDYWFSYVNFDGDRNTSPSVTSLKRISWDFGSFTGKTGSHITRTNPTGGYRNTNNYYGRAEFETPLTLSDAFVNPRTVTIRTNRLNDINYIHFYGSSKPFGHLDFSEFSGLETLKIDGGGSEYVTGATFPTSYRSDKSLSTLSIQVHPASNIQNNWISGGTGLVGELVLTGVTLGGGTGFNDASNGGYFNIYNQPFLNSIKHGSSDKKFYQYRITGGLVNTNTWDYPVPPGSGYSGLTGTHDMSMLSGLGGWVYIAYHPHLTEVLFPEMGNNRFCMLDLSKCPLEGDLDLSGIDIGDAVVDGFTPQPNYTLQGGFFSVGWYTHAVGYKTINLTGVTHGPNNSNINTYRCSGTGIKTLDLSMLKLGSPVDKLYIAGSNYVGQFDASWNPNITGITHTYTDLYFKNYAISMNPELLNHDMSMISNLCGYFTAASCGKMRTLSHTASTSTYPFTEYNISSSGIENNHDMSWAPKLGGKFLAFSCPNLTGITHTATTEVFTRYEAYSCSLTDTLVLTGLTGLGGEFQVENNKGDYYHTVPVWPNPRPTGLREILHTGSTENFSIYNASYCALEGELDVSMLENLGGTFNVKHNYSGFSSYYGDLTNILFPSNDRAITVNAGYCNLEHTYDFSMLSGITYLNVEHNGRVTGITFNNNHIPTTSIYVNNCDIKPDLNFDSINMTGLTALNCANNVSLTGVTFAPSDTSLSITAEYCDITGNWDLSPSSGVTWLDCNHNPNLTGITHSTSSEDITYYVFHDCNLTGNLDLSMLDTLGKADPSTGYYTAGNTYTNGGSFYVNENPNLTGITHCATSKLISVYHVGNCNLIGNHDMSKLPNIGPGVINNSGYGIGVIYLNGNTNLTGVTHSASTASPPTYLRRYSCSYTGLIGDHDISMLDIGAGRDGDMYYLSGWEAGIDSGSYSDWVGIDMNNNSSLTSVTHANSSRKINRYDLQSNNITGVHDMSSLSGVGITIRMDNNPLLTDVVFPPTTRYLFDKSAHSYNSAIQLYDCDLGYVNFLPLSGATMHNPANTANATIDLSDNNMTASEVNHILVDFKDITVTHNTAGWTGTTLIIDGTNAAPDTTSGGNNGSAAVTTLTSSPYNWTITTS